MYREIQNFGRKFLSKISRDGFPRREILLLDPAGWVGISIVFQIIHPDFLKCFGSIVPFLSYFVSLTALHIRGDPWCQKKVKGTIVCLVPNLCLFYASYKPFYYHCLHNNPTNGVLVSLFEWGSKEVLGGVTHLLQADSTVSEFFYRW